MTMLNMRTNDLSRFASRLVCLRWKEKQRFFHFDNSPKIHENISIWNFQLMFMKTVVDELISSSFIHEQPNKSSNENTRDSLYVSLKFVRWCDMVW